MRLTKTDPATWKWYDDPEAQWQEFKRQAAECSIRSMARYASVSTRRGHRCMSCFCCACLTVFREIHGVKELDNDLQ